MAGEPTATSIILQSRLTAAGSDPRVPMREGFIQFQLWPEGREGQARVTERLRAEPANDGIVKVFVKNLEPGQTYIYRPWYGSSASALVPGQFCRFRTLHGAESDIEANFCVFSCMAYDQFFLEPLSSGVPYLGTDKPLGYPGLASMELLEPNFAVGTGDAVYYDGVSGKAESREEMRQRWREQAILPRFKAFFGSVGSYWQKDDHDYRFNDSDPFMPGRPSAEDGKAVFLEQVPVLARGSPQTIYRTHRVSRDLQIWMTEGRDFRSPNDMADGPEKTLWGAQQRAWLQASLRESDARHLVLISPDPMIGPDFATKSDNHANPNGFRYERDSFFQFVVSRELADRLTIVCGDRHWPYHSVSREGIHELSTGTLTDGCEEFPPPKPGDPNSTDPRGEVDQRFLHSRPIASFIHVVSPGRHHPIRLEIWSSQGDLLYRTFRP